MSSATIFIALCALLVANACHAAVVSTTVAPSVGAAATAATAGAIGAVEASVVEESTESPIADMALIGRQPLNPSNAPTDRPPAVVREASVATADDTIMVNPDSLGQQKSTQPHTVADFIIHPLIAFKPRQAGIEEQLQGKQATPANTPANNNWFFSMNPAQSLPSISSLAGSVSGWFSDRLAAAGQQLPGLVDTPVRESTSTSTTTTTTQRPDIVVRVQQRPGRRPGFNGNANFNGNGNGNGNFNGNNRNRQRPNRFNNRPFNNNNNFNRLDSLEDDEYYDDYFDDHRFDDHFEDEEPQDDASNDTDEFEDNEHSLAADNASAVNEQTSNKQKRRRPAQTQAQTQQKQKPQTQRRKVHSQSQTNSQAQSQSQSTRRRVQPQHNTQRQPLVQSTKRRRPEQQSQVAAQAAEDSEELQSEDEEDDDAEFDDDSEENVYDDSNRFYYGTQSAAGGSASSGSSHSTRRSQNQPTFIQRGQQSIINQIRQFTRGQTPGELGTKLSKQGISGATSGNKLRRPQQTTLLVNRNGQAIYVSPELLSLSPVAVPSNGYSYYQTKKTQRVPASAFPQPPLTLPVRRQNRPTQYITIPWSQLGISPPDQSSISLAEGIQAQPLILNIPQNAISAVPVRNTNAQKRKKRPQLTAAAIPLLADASLMDIFQPPQIPPSRTSATTTNAAATPLLIAAKPLKNSGSPNLLPTRIRPGTIVEKAPAVSETMESTPMKNASASSEELDGNMSAAAGTASAETAGASSTQAAAQGTTEQHNSEQEYILVGEDGEPGLMRNVQPAFGDARYVAYGDLNPYFDLVHHNRRFALRKGGRALSLAEKLTEELPEGVVDTKTAAKEHFIPVEVVNDDGQTKVAPEISAEQIPEAQIPLELDVDSSVKSTEVVDGQQPVAIVEPNSESTIVAQAKIESDSSVPAP
ncbi:uncharacterized protein LOC115633373 [Scaptodrosophila lebanonensis]|uniref:Uncharacterized protein LOC115633373 n=1 Tax=Drosophila lebanonensis TaxID=7225 RepID=A0A6J2UHN4_DROLE|nr:uncharacterized protein LOC115633373 [Scaptodrosophila lebanonensis]